MKKLDELITRYPVLRSCRQSISDTCNHLTETFTRGGRLFIVGNGGSAADALHMAGELVKSFVLKRPLDESFCRSVSDELLLNNLQGALPAFALVENIALSSAFANDCNADFVYAQQVYAYAREGDCVLGISTSGNSKSIVPALAAARGRRAITLGLTGSNGGKVEVLCDSCICVPETETYKVQELHLPVYHTLCLMLEEHFWGDKN